MDGLFPNWKHGAVDEGLRLAMRLPENQHLSSWWTEREKQGMLVVSILLE